MARFDTVVLGGAVVLPGCGATRCDLGIRDGKIVAIADALSSSEATDAIDATGLYVAPGAVDAHAHLGIYRPVDVDAESETASSLVGGATSMISYFRTGQHYLNKAGSYREILPELLDRVRGKSYVDIGFHLAPMDAGHVNEIDWLAGEAGVASFKYYFFYKGLNLAADSTDAAAYTMSDQYDFGHLYAMMEAVQAADARSGDAGRISLSLHTARTPSSSSSSSSGCEVPGCLLSRSIRRLARRCASASRFTRLESWRTPRRSGSTSSISRVPRRFVRRGRCAPSIRRSTCGSRPPFTIFRSPTRCSKARASAGKVNPPIRAQEDVEALWQAVSDRTLQWVASDHACCLEELKGDDLWPAQPGFGGTALI